MKRIIIIMREREGDRQTDRQNSELRMLLSFFLFSFFGGWVGGGGGGEIVFFVLFFVFCKPPESLQMVNY